MFSLETRLLLLLFNVLFICHHDFKTDAAKNITNMKPSNISFVIDFAGNEKRKAIQNPSLHLTIRGFPSASHETNDHEPKPVSNKEQSDAEEMLTNDCCTAEGNATQDRIVPRSAWKTKEALILNERSKEADIIIADDSYIRFSGESIDWIRRTETYEVTAFGGLLSNFYIGDDGVIYEGLGWNHWNSLANGGLGYRSLIVRFMRIKRSSLSEAAERAYKELLKTAICKRILSPQYKLISTDIIWDQRNKNYEKSELSNWDHYKENLDFIFTDEGKDEGLFSVSVREEWNEDELPEDLFIYQPTIDKIYVTNLGPRCFNYYGCIQVVKFLSKSYLMVDFSEQVNFVIGEDGGIYEVIGWKLSHKNEFPEKPMIVLFAGNFGQYAPHRRAMIAFHRLVKLGIWLGKVSPKYKLFKIEQPYLKTGKRLISEFKKELQTVVKSPE